MTSRLSVAAPSGPDVVPPSAPADSAAEDAEIVRSSIRDPALFTLIFDRYFSQVHTYVARRLDRDVADDVTSETFLIAFRKRNGFDGHRGVVRAWLYGIATNLIRNHRREEVLAWRGTAKLFALAGSADHQDQVAAQVLDQRLSDRLDAALAKVSAKDREVLMLVALGELSYDEVAVALDIPYGTVCSRLSRARRVIQKNLEQANPTVDKES